MTAEAKKQALKEVRCEFLIELDDLYSLAGWEIVE